MAGLSKTRVDYGDKGPVTKSDDKRTGGNGQDSSVPQPTRAQRPISKTENDYTSSESAATPKARQTSGEGA